MHAIATKEMILDYIQLFICTLYFVIAQNPELS